MVVVCVGGGERWEGQLATRPTSCLWPCGMVNRGWRTGQRVGGGGGIWLSVELQAAGMPKWAVARSEQRLLLPARPWRSECEWQWDWGLLIGSFCDWHCRSAAAAHPRWGHPCSSSPHAESCLLPACAAHTPACLPHPTPTQPPGPVCRLAPTSASSRPTSISLTSGTPPLPRSCRRLPRSTVRGSRRWECNAVR